jgi:DivIVA domain-containing protein
VAEQSTGGYVPPRFTVVWRGYDRGEVDTFIRRLVAETLVGNDFSRAGTEVASALRSLHSSVVDIRNQAEDEAARLRREAEEHAAHVRAEADAEVQRRRADLEHLTVARRLEAEADAERTTAAARARLAEAEQMLQEATVTSDEKVREADEYLLHTQQRSEAEARARATAVVEEVQADLARLVRERDTVRAQLDHLRRAIAEAIGDAASRPLDLTDEVTRAPESSGDGDGPLTPAPANGADASAREDPPVFPRPNPF